MTTPTANQTNQADGPNTPETTPDTSETAPTTLPWDPQPKETPRAYEAFKAYLAMDPDHRSLRELGKMLNKNYTQLGQWSTKYSWQERCRRYDRHQSAIWFKEMDDNRRKAAQAQVRTARVLREKAMKRAYRLDPDELTPTELLRFIDLATRTERDAYGEAQKLDITSAGKALHDPLDALTPEERVVRLRELRSKIDAMLSGDDSDDDALDDRDDDDDITDEVPKVRVTRLEDLVGSEDAAAAG